MSRIIVISVEGRLADVKLPLTEHRLEEVRDYTGNHYVERDEERKMLDWVHAVNAGDPPLDEDRLKQLMENPSERTKIAEDQAIAKWILEVWEIIKDIRTR